jgi:hypothetical protein
VGANVNARAGEDELEKELALMAEKTEAGVDFLLPRPFSTSMRSLRSWKKSI